MSCTTTAKLDDINVQSIQSGAKGGLVVSIDKIRGLECTTGKLAFSNLATKEKVVANYTFGILGFKSTTNIFEAAPGRYMPTGGVCETWREVNGVQRMVASKRLMVVNFLVPPVEVVAGEVTVSGSYYITDTGSSMQSYRILDDAEKIQSKLSKKYPDLKFRIWEKGSFGKP